MNTQSMNNWADWLSTSVMYSAWAAVGDGSYYTITRDIAGGPFKPRHRGIAIGPAGRMRDARSACRRHNGAALEWVDQCQVRANA